MRTQIIVLLIVMLSISLAPAQEKLEETLRWFPGEDYSFIGHYELDKVKTEEFENLLKRGYDSVMSHYKNQYLLPEHLFSLADSFTCGKFAKVKIQNLSETRKKFKNNAFIHTSPNSRLVQTEIGGYEFLFSEEGYMLFIYRYLDLASALKKAVSEGELEKTDKSIAGNLIYSFRGTGMSRKKESTFYALPTSTGELLVAASIKLLKKMYEAGLVAEEAFIRSDKYQLLKDFSGDMGLAWCYCDRSLINRSILEKNEELQGDGTDLGMIRSDLEAGGEFKLSVVKGGQNPDLINYRVYRDEEAAASQVEAGSGWRVKGNICYKIIEAESKS